jgi:hypothetical protein
MNAQGRMPGKRYAPDQDFDQGVRQAGSCPARAPRGPPAYRSNVLEDKKSATQGQISGVKPPVGLQLTAQLLVDVRMEGRLMHCWERFGDSGYVRVLSKHEIDVLRSYTSGLTALIEHRVASYAPITVRPGHQVHLPTEVTGDPRIIAILKAELGNDEPDWVLAMNEEQCLLSVKRAMHIMELTLPTADGVVQLRSHDEALAWLSSIQLFITSIAAMIDEEGMVKGMDAGPTVVWLIELSCTLRSAVERTIETS